jgi:hypothetical protein
MNHPMLVAALAADHRRHCPCGAVTQRPSSLCRKCRAATTWPRETVRMSCRTNPSRTRDRTAKARFFTWIASLLQNISKGAEN